MIHVENLSNATPEVYASCLQGGTYDFMVQACVPGSWPAGGQRLSFELLVENGPDQTIERKNHATGEVTLETRSPVGRHMFYDQTLPASSHSDGGDFCRARLAKICEVLGVEQSDDIDEQEFVGKRFKAVVKIVYKDKAGADLPNPRNDISKWLPLD